jgi:hypothetical protein
MNIGFAETSFWIAFTTYGTRHENAEIDPAAPPVTCCELMNIACPSCRSAIAMDDVNVSTDIALCRGCGETFSLSAIVGGAGIDGPDLNAPPSGAWFEQLSRGFRVGASTRSWMALFLVPFTCVWAGMSLSGIYGKQITSRHFDPFSSLFGLPFLVGSIALVSMCAMTVAGKVELLQSEDRLSVFIGVGPLGWSRKFQWSDFSSAREDSRRTGFRWNGQGQAIVLEGKRRVALGSMWNEEKRYFVLSVLKKMLRDANRVRSSTIVAPRFR